MDQKALVFDVNETLLDLRALDPLFAELFGTASARNEWFAQLLRWSLVVTLTDSFRDFSKLAADSLAAVAEAHDRPLAEHERARVFEGIRTLPPHPDVEPALTQLRAAGFRLTALTNSAQATVSAQLDHTGLRPLFDQVLSVDAVACFKPHPAVYRYAAKQLGVAIGAIRLVAAHDWDVTGALAAGCAAAFVGRGNAVFNPAGRRPDITGASMTAVAEQIIATDRP